MKNERLVRNVIIAVMVLVVFWFGILPLLTGDRYEAMMNRIDRDVLAGTRGEYAVVVIGSEPEGVAAAITSAKSGIRTLLITHEVNLGSYISNTMLSQINPQNASINGKVVKLNEGVYVEMFGDVGISFTSAEYLQNIERLVKAQSNLDIWYETVMTDVKTEGTQVISLQVMQNGESKQIDADIYIDATEDGLLLEELAVPYTLGSEDIGAKNLYEPVSFHFRMGNVLWDELLKIRNVADLATEFQEAISAYQRTNPHIKLVNPTFVKQDENTILVKGLQLAFVDVADPEALASAYKILEEESRYLTVYIKNTIIPFQNATYEVGAEALYIPEYRHYIGLERVTVSDIMASKRPTVTVALSSAPVDAGRFLTTDYDAIVTHPIVYGLPLGAYIPVGWDNVLMPGKKASFQSMAATSGTSIPSTVTSAQGLGAAAAFCLVNHVTPAEVLRLGSKEINNFHAFLERTGVALPIYHEDIQLPKEEKLLSEHWAYPYVLALAERGLILGGDSNDFRLDSETTNEVFVVLLNNTVLRMATKQWSVDLANRLQKLANTQTLSAQSAAEMCMVVLGKNADLGVDGLIQLGFLPKTVTDKLASGGTLTMDMAYALVVSVCEELATSSAAVP